MEESKYLTFNAQEGSIWLIKGGEELSYLVSRLGDITKHSDGIEMAESMALAIIKLAKLIPGWDEDNPQITIEE